MFKTIGKNSELYTNLGIIENNKTLLKPIPLYDFILSKYAKIVSYYPMNQTKFDIYFKLDKHQRLGMLNRHILSVASKMGVYKTILDEINRLRNTHKYSKKYSNSDRNDDFWQKTYDKNQLEYKKQFNLLLDIIIEEINRRNDVKYLRKKKIKEIKENLQN